MAATQIDELKSELDTDLLALEAGRKRLADASPVELAELAEAALAGTVRVASRWVDAACRAKGIDQASPIRAEELSAGPLATARYLRLIAASLRDVENHGAPRLPGSPQQRPDGQLTVPVFPARGLFDPLVFLRFRAELWMQEHVTRENLQNRAAAPFPADVDEIKTALILGAGNVSSIPATDAFTKIFQQRRVVLLKMHPVNEYLGPIFEDAYRPLFEAGLLRLVYGGAEAGAAAIARKQVDEVHITGSIHTHDAIVWGPEGPERDRRKRENDPLLKKPITSELGNVSPWMIVPGQYSSRELDFQAENVAASITNNASFNCVATKVIVTWKKWPQRQEFLDRLQRILDKVPRRKAYYPGAEERFRRFTNLSEGGSSGRDHAAGELDESGTLPWTLIRDVDPDESPLFFNEESFVCVCVETGLDADTENEFLERAVEFVNERLWGTLCAAITIPPGFRSRPGGEAVFQRALENLRYGSVAVNHWPGVMYALMTPPWGGYPGSSLADAQSGIGSVHNTYMLDGVEKAVLYGPLTMSLKPFWFPTHRDPEPLGWRLLELYEKPNVWNLLRLFQTAGPRAFG